jgi:hypothetical protein
MLQCNVASKPAQPARNKYDGDWQELSVLEKIWIHVYLLDFYVQKQA